MTNPTRHKKQLIFHPLLVTAAPVLSLYVINAEQILLREALDLLLMVLFISAVLWLSLGFLSKRFDKAACFTSLFAFSFFNYERLIYTPDQSGMLLKLIFWAGLLAMATYLIIRSRRDFGPLTSFLNVVSLGWIAAIVIPWLYYSLMIAQSSTARANEYIAMWKQEVEQPLGTQVISDTRQLPDVYYIILDGYGRADILNQWYQDDASAFLTFLRDKGFYVADKSITNYAQTALSQSSSLNFQYLDNLAQQLTTETSNRLPLEAMLETNRLFQFLRDQGYRIVTFPTGYLFTDITTGVDRQMSPPGSLTSFQTELLKSTPVPSLLYVFTHKSLYDLHRERILYALEHLPEAVSGDSPSLVYAHILAPHPPFVFGPKGEPKAADQQSFSLADNGWSRLHGREAYVQGYRDQRQFISSRLYTTIDQILSVARRPTIIVIQGDHGPGSMVDWENPQNTYFPERMSILNAYYFSDQDYAALYPGISPVNTFRVILDTYFGATLPLLEDRSYFSRMTRPYDFIDVTDKVKVGP